MEFCFNEMDIFQKNKNISLHYLFEKLLLISIFIYAIYYYHSFE
jgi:hypothetical protein